MNGLIDQSCKGCIHLGGTSTWSNFKSCDYILHKKKKPRPCPAGSGCTEYVGVTRRGVSRGNDDPWDNWSYGRRKR